MSDPKPEDVKIQFPCPDYPIKVLGTAGDELHALVIAVFRKHAPDFDAEAIKIRDSAKGSFQSLTVTIEATGEAQLQAIFDDLKVSKLVKMVL
jgi:putative lipoic acid-binding regulatory protein